MERGINNWREFEDRVAEAYRSFDAVKVQQNISLAGQQIDIYLEEKTASGQIVRTAVECKFHRTRVGKDIVTRYALIFEFLRQAKLIDRGIIVADVGFSPEAHSAAKEFGIDLITLKLLTTPARKPITQIVNIEPLRVYVQFPKPKIIQTEPESKMRRIFVVMPFSNDYEDLYVFGIRGAADKTGFTCVRGDEIEHNSDIMKEINDQISNSDVIIAETTEKNPNVMYEVGIAHGKDKQVILIAKEGCDIPFDLKGINHILYKNINDLRGKLLRRLKS